MYVCVCVCVCVCFERNYRFSNCQGRENLMYDYMKLGAWSERMSYCNVSLTPERKIDSYKFLTIQRVTKT